MRRTIKPHPSTLARRARFAELSLKKQGSVIAKIGWPNIISFGVSASIVVFALVAVFDHTVILEPFDVPKSYEEKGIKGDLLARRVADEVEFVNRSVPMNIAGRSISIPAEATSVPSLEVPGVHLQLADFIRVVQSTLGIKPQRIHVDLVGTESELHGRVRVSGPSLDVTEVQIKDPQVDSITRDMTQAVLRLQNPLAAAAYSIGHQDFSDALVYASEAVQRDRPDHLPAAYNLYAVAASNLQLPGFEKLFQKSIDLRPTPEAELNWALALVLVQRQNEAIEHLRRALKLDSKNYLANVTLGLLNPPPSGLRYFREAIRSKPEEGYAYCALAETLSKSISRSDELDCAMRECVQRSPQYLGAIDRNVMESLQILHAPDHAEEALQSSQIDHLHQMIGQGRDDAKAYFELGLLEIRLKKFDAADTDFLGAVLRAPSDSKAYEQLAILRGYRCTHGGSLTFCDSALPWFSRAAELNLRAGGKSHLSTYACQTWGYTLLAEHEWDRAAEQFSTAAQQEPTNFLALYMQANALYLGGRHEEALKFLQRATTLASGEGRDLTFFLKGEVEVELRDATAAKEAFKQMQSGDPTHDLKYFFVKYGPPDSAWRAVIKDEQLTAY